MTRSQPDRNSHRRTREKSYELTFRALSRQDGGPSFADSQGNENLADEALRFHQVGRARLKSLEAEGVGSEETCHHGRPLDESVHGASPPPQTPHLDGHSGKLEIYLRRMHAESACADGGPTALATRSPDCPPEAAVCESTSWGLHGVEGHRGLREQRAGWDGESNPGRGRLKPLIGRLSSDSSSPPTRIPSSPYESQSVVGNMA
ncbi:hypothetical protein Efla_004508 [Eimeria flavescens]